MKLFSHQMVKIYPAGTTRWNNVKIWFGTRQELISITLQRNSNIRCPLGTVLFLLKK